MRHANRRRVVVTGLGMVASVGVGVEEPWKNLVEGKSGIGPITRFDSKDFDTHFAGEVKNFDPTNWIDKREVKKIDLYAQYAMAAAKIAVADSKIDFKAMDAKRGGCVIGTGIGGLTTVEEQYDRFREKGPGKLSAFLVPKMMANAASGQIGIELGLKGPNHAVASACASGAHALGDALRLIQEGWADTIVSGGAEATVCYLGVGGFNALHALSVRNDAPEKASRPFDKNRDGFVLSEGAGVLVLEEYEQAKARGAHIYCEFLGFGATCDAYHITAPDETADGPCRAMRMAIEDAGVRPEDVDYINAHGTSTAYNDKIETAAIKLAFGDHARKLAVSSTKSMTGHALGAAGGIEAVISALAVERGVLPPTINYETPDPDCDLDYVPNTARKADVKVVLSNSLGFGGHNAVLCFGKVRS
ncbi:MAG TPA: beta-ketoacyl-ACP synthase II [Planctomycetota bacterium]|nr:beta-ketoacyl-ACP synthase II [Planctomycetota bacterium]